MAKGDLKIAIIEPVGGHGGLDYYDYGLSYGLGESGCEVYYFTCKQTNRRDYPNVQTKYTFGNIWDQNRLLKGFYFFWGYFYSFLLARYKGCQCVHLHFFDLELLNNLVLVLAKKFFQFKIIVTIHDVESFKGGTSNNKKQEILDLIDQIIVHNNFSRNELIAKGAKQQKIHVIPHGNYLSFIEELEYKPNKNSESLELLFFGQIKEVKGLNILLEAIALVVKKNKNIHLTIVGRPWHDNMEKYDRIINKHNLSPYITTRYEFIPYEEVSKYFLETDLVVLPYKRIYQSGVLLLSMSYGRPVLTSDLDPFQEIITHNKTGLLFESENEYDLADQICSIARNSDKLIYIRNNAIETLKSKFDWNDIGEMTKSVYCMS